MFKIALYQSDLQKDFFSKYRFGIYKILLFNAIPVKNGMSVIGCTVSILSIKCNPPEKKGAYETKLKKREEPETENFVSHLSNDIGFQGDRPEGG